MSRAILLHPDTYYKLCASLGVEPGDSRHIAGTISTGWIKPSDYKLAIREYQAASFLGMSPRVATEYPTAQVNPYDIPDEPRHDTDRPPVTKLCYYCGREPVHVVKHDQPAVCPSCTRRAQRPRRK